MKSKMRQIDDVDEYDYRPNRPIIPQSGFDSVESPAPFYMRLEQLPFSKWHYYAVITLSGGLLIDGFEIALVPIVSGELQRVFGATESSIGLLGTLYFIGAGIGSILFGFYAQEHGRKKVFYITISIYAIAILFVMISQSMGFLYLTRVVSGIGIGGEYTAIFAMVDEIVPSQYRGVANVCVSTMWHVGSMLAGFIGLLFESRLNDVNDRHTWRFLFLFGVLFVIPIMYLRKYLPESPRWIFGQNKQSEAEVVVDLITYCSEHDCIIPLEEYKILQQKPRTIGLHPQNYQTMADDQSPDNLLDVLRIIANKYRKRFALCFTLTFASNFVYKGLFITHSMMMNKLNPNKQYSESYFVLPLIIASFLGPLVSAQFFDTQGRRRVNSFIFFVSGALLFVNGFLFDFGLITPKLQLLLWITIIFFTSPGISSSHLAVSEVFPLALRSQALALFNAIGLCVGGAIAPYFFGVLIKVNSVDSLSLGYFCSGCIMMTASLVSFALGIHAENLPLEHIEIQD